MSSNATPSLDWLPPGRKRSTAEGRTSPEDDLEAIRKVTLADVNRVAKQYLVANNSITATLKPSPSGEAVAAKGFGGGREVTSAPTKPVALAGLGQRSISQLKVPADYIDASDTTLPNGLRLIVRTDNTSPTVTVIGSVEEQRRSADPEGKDGARMFWTASTPMARPRSTAWPSRRPSTISPPTRTRVSTSRSSAEGIFLSRRAVAGRQRTASRAAREAFEVVKQQTGSLLPAT